MATFLGTLPTVTAGQDILGTDIATLISALHALTDQWSSFSSTWRSTGTAPALGNGSLVGRYFQAGALVVGRITLTPGSTSTFGTGSYNFDLPGAGLLSGNQWQSLGACTIRDSSGATTYALSAFSASTTVISAANGSGNRLGALSPVTLASSDTLDFDFAYESA